MTEELYPESPTALNVSQRRTQTILGHRFKILKASGTNDFGPDEIQLTALSSPNPEEHKLFRDDDSSDEEMIEESQPKDDQCGSYMSAITPNIKRFKLDKGTEGIEDDVPLMQKRKLNYESDESIRHSILDSESSDDDEPPFFHFYKSDHLNVVPEKPKVSSPADIKLDLSASSKLAENLNELSQYYDSQKAEEAEGDLTKILIEANISMEEDSNLSEAEHQSTEFQVPPSQMVKEEPDGDEDDSYSPQPSSFKFGGEIPPGAYAGFQTAAGHKIEIEENNQLNLFEDSPPAEGGRHSPAFGGEIPEGAYLGFQTAAGVKIEVDGNDQMDLFGDSQSMDDIDSLLKSAVEEFSQRRIQNHPAPTEIPEFVGFTTAGGKNLFQLSEQELQKAKAWEKQLDKVVPKLLIEEKEPDDGISVDYLEKLNHIEKKKKPEFASPKLPAFRAKISTPIAKPRSSVPTFSQEISAAVNAVMQDSEFLDERLFFRDVSDHSFGKIFGSQAPFSPIAKQTAKPKTPQTFSQIDNSRRNMLKSQITEDMKCQRQRMISSLEEVPKSAELCKPFRSEFIEKKLGRGKKPLKEVFGCKLIAGAPPRGLDLENLQMDDLLDFKFDSLHNHSNDQIRSGFVTGLPIDHFTVPMTEGLWIGIKEIEVAFFSAKGIDPKLISKEWFQNAYKLIIWKLFSLEVYSESGAKGDWLTPGNVLNELHYRYYQEIDCSKQSILKNCLEKDDNPGYLMVLFVMDIMENHLILSDGYYSVKTKIDECLEEQLEKGRIQRGTKLIVDSAEFHGLDQGYAPLEVPDFVSLKIFGNSTRRCRWHTKLGRFFKRNRLKISLNNVHPKGGLISAVDLVVIRKYPLLFVSGNRHRNERMQRKYKKELETRHFNLFEKLYHQIELELIEEEHELRESLDLDRLRTIREVTDVKEIYDLLQASRDPQYFEDQLSVVQKRQLEEFKQKTLLERSEKVRQRVKERMDEDMSNESVLLRIKVASGTSFTDHCGELWLWNPAEELDKYILLEGKSIEMENVMVTGMRNNILQLKSSRRTIIKESTNQNIHSPSSSGISRTFTKLMDIKSIREYSPVFGEFDTVVIILKISRRISEKFQHVFATDDQTNLICLNFWNGLHEFSYEDLVTPGKVISLSNLQWRKNSNSFGIPNGYVTELTVLTMSPGQVEQREEISKYSEFLEANGLTEIEENVAARYPFFRDIKVESSGQMNFNESLNEQSPIVKTPVAKRRCKGMATPGPSALKTPLIERQINLLRR